MDEVTRLIGQSARLIDEVVGPTREYQRMLSDSLRPIREHERMIADMLRPLHAQERMMDEALRPLRDYERMMEECLRPIRQAEEGLRQLFPPAAAEQIALANLVRPIEMAHPIGERLQAIIGEQSLGRAMSVLRGEQSLLDRLGASVTGNTLFDADTLTGLKASAMYGAPHWLEDTISGLTNQIDILRSHAIMEPIGTDISAAEVRRVAFSILKGVPTTNGRPANSVVTAVEAVPLAHRKAVATALLMSLIWLLLAIAQGEVQYYAGIALKPMRRAVVRYVRRLAAPSARTADDVRLVTTPRLHVRAAPRRFDSRIIGMIAFPDLVVVETSTGSWTRIRLKEGDAEVEGWVFTRYLQRVRVPPGDAPDDER